jgi:hypothetical protein
MNNTIFLGKRNLKSSNTANTVGIWSLHDINEMRHYDFITAIVSRNVIVTFKESGSWLCPTGVTEVEYLVIAGGAGGGTNRKGGGGGAGGYRTGTGLSVTAGNTYTITVGAGGNGTTSSSGSGSSGSNSIFSTITSMCF